MGLLSGLLGNASEVDPVKLQGEFAQVLAAGERVEKAYLLVRDMGLDLVGVFNADADGVFLGMPVQAIAEHKAVAFDVLVVAVLEKPAGTAKLLRQCGVPDEKVLMLRPDWRSPRVAAAPTDAGPNESEP